MPKMLKCALHSLVPCMYPKCDQLSKTCNVHTKTELKLFTDTLNSYPFPMLNVNCSTGNFANPLKVTTKIMALMDGVN